MLYQVVYRAPDSQWELWHSSVLYHQVQWEKNDCKQHCPPDTLIGVLQGPDNDYLFQKYARLVESGDPDGWAMPPEVPELDRRRLELEAGPGGDRDQPYFFQMPQDWSIKRAWLKLLAKVQRGELEP